MTWTKLSDDFADDCWELSDAAYRLHTEGLIWSNRKLLDCRLSKDLDEMRRWAKRPEALAELLDRGWWEDRGDHYEIIHHACYQRTREAVLAQQEANRKNGEKGGRPPGPPRERAPRKPRWKGNQENESRTESESQWVSERDDVSASETHSLTESESEIPTERAGPGEGKVPTKPGTSPAHEGSAELNGENPACLRCLKSPQTPGHEPWCESCASAEAENIATLVTDGILEPPASGRTWCLRCTDKLAKSGRDFCFFCLLDMRKEAEATA